LILASASPRRAELLRAAGIEFDVLVAAVDESIRPGEAPEEHVRRRAEDKARAVIAQAGDRPVLAADTVVVVDGTILGKPADSEDAKRMLRRLSGRVHEVVTGVALVLGEGDSRPRQTDRKGRLDDEEIAGPTCEVHVEVAVTTVEFAELSDADIAWYVVSGEPADKAGAYAVQGLASRFVTRIEGSYSNVVGLPVAVVCQMCKRAGLLLP
jgi:septum formation protein